MAERMHISALLKRCPSLLTLDGILPHECADELDRRIFTDLNLDKLMSESELDILARPASPEEIKARQSIFAMLDDTDFAEDMASLHKTLTALTQAHEAYKTAQTSLERLFLFVRLAEKMTEAYSVEPIKNDGRLAQALNGYLGSSEVTAFIDKLRTETTSARELCERISVFSPTFDARTGTMNTDAPEGSIHDELRAYGEKLGISDRSAHRSAANEQRLTTELSDAITRLYTAETDRLLQFEIRWEELTDDRLRNVRGEVGFYLSIHELVHKAERLGMPLCFPKVSDTPIYRAHDACDLSLMIKKTSVVGNDIEFTSDESVFFLTGANGGGKTTYLRSAAINLLLFLVGAPICARSALIYPFSGVFTHFPGDERFTGSGRLIDERQRMDDILSRAEACKKVRASFTLLNESFSGTDDKKGLGLTLETVERLKSSDSFVLYVTHFHEVADSGYPVLTTVIDESDENRRTYRITRVGASRSSFARDILKKYDLDSDSLERRMRKDGDAK